MFFENVFWKGEKGVVTHIFCTVTNHRVQRKAIILDISNFHSDLLNLDNQNLFVAMTKVYFISEELNFEYTHPI